MYCERLALLHDHGARRPSSSTVLCSEVTMGALSSKIEPNQALERNGVISVESEESVGFKDTFSYYSCCRHILRHTNSRGRTRRLGLWKRYDVECREEWPLCYA